VLAFIRDQKRERLLFTPEVAEMIVRDAEDLLAEVPARQAALRECLQTLPERSRELLMQKYARGAKIQQISVEMGRSVDGVKSLLLRVRKALAECIERRLALEDGNV
jgi:RNA polymerase sigma-70 factor (ECF subfamily)